MRIFSARIFSKSFGGKIQNFQTNSNDMGKLKKKGKKKKETARAYFGLLAGKFDKIEQQLP